MSLLTHQALLGIASGDYATLLLTYSPLVYCKLGDTSGTVAVDSSGNGRNLTYVTTPTLGQTGLILAEPGTCVLFNTGYATLADAVWMEPTVMTVTAIIRPTNVTNYQHLFDKDNAGTTGWWLRINNTGTVEFSLLLTTGRQVVTSSAILASTTYVVTATYDLANIRLYINGTQVASAAHTAAIVHNSAPLSIARNGANILNYTGRAQHVALFGTVLTAPQIDGLATKAGY